MWFTGSPRFAAIESNVTYSCLTKPYHKPNTYMSRFLPGNYSGSVSNPAFLTLPGATLEIRIASEVLSYRKVISRWNSSFLRRLLWSPYEQPK